MGEIAGKGTKIFNLDKDEICVFFRPETDDEGIEATFQSFLENGQQIGETKKLFHKGEYMIYYINKNGKRDGGDFMDNILMYPSGKYRIKIICGDREYSEMITVTGI